MRTVLVTMLVFPLLAGGSTSAFEEMTIVYSGNLRGELEPCGCTREGDLGGIHRNATAVDRLRKERPNLFLVSSGGLLSTDLPSHRITSEYILKGVAKLGYDAVGVQWGDLAYGTEFLASSSLPLVASNWLGEEFTVVRNVGRDGRQLAYFQWLVPEQSPYRRMRGQHVRVTADTAMIGKALAEAQAGGMLTILGTTLHVALAKEFLPLQHLDVLIVPWGREQFGEPEKLGNTLILVPGSRGQRLGRLDLSFGDDGRISTWRHEVISLPDSVPNSPRMRKWYEAYTEAIKKHYAEWVAHERAVERDSPYVGSDVCRACHQHAYNDWKSSSHAQAFSSLEDVEKSFDANCIGCHTVGFSRPGGFIDPQTTAHLMDVGCEACHGPGKEHAASAGTLSIHGNQALTPTTCAACHNHSHSPSFQYERYWPRIRHGQKPNLSRYQAR